MKWLATVLNILADLVAIKPYVRAIGVVFGVLLMLVALIFGSNATLLLGGVLAVFSAFWPNQKPEAQE